MAFIYRGKHPHCDKDLGERSRAQGPSCYLSNGLEVCEIKLSQMGINSGNSDLVC